MPASISSKFKFRAIRHFGQIILLWLLIFATNLSAIAQSLVWTQTDIGTVGTPGTYSYSGGTYTVGGSGSGPGSTSDNFCAVTTPVSGNVEITARLASQTNTDSGAYAGVMLRQSLAPDSAAVFIGVRIGSGLQVISRAASGEAATTINGPSSGSPIFVRLIKNDSTIQAYYSSDRLQWTLLSTQTGIAISGTYQLGFTVSSNATGLTNATFDEASVFTRMPSKNASGFIGWYRADAGLTVAGQNQVTAWDSQTGTTNLNPSSPMTVAGGLNGLPAVNFPGSFLGSFPAPVGPGITIIAVLKPDINSGWRSFCGLKATGGASNAMALAVDSQPEQNLSFSCSEVVSGSQLRSQLQGTGLYGTSFSYGFQTVVATQDSSGNTSLLRNGQLLSSGAVGVFSSSVAADIQLGNDTSGSSQGFIGDIAEFLVYGRGLTTTELNDVQSYLNAKYNLPQTPGPTITPPGGVFNTNASPVSVSIGIPVDAFLTFYTTDGSDPRSSPTRRSYGGGPFSVSTSSTLKFCSQFQFGTYYSTVSSASFRFDSLSDFIPRNGLKWWLKGDQGVDLASPVTPSTPEQVASWANQAGISEAVHGGYGPTLITSDLNSKPVLKFSAPIGSSGSRYLTFAPGFQSMASGLTIYALASSALASNAPLLSLSDGVLTNEVRLALVSNNADFSIGSNHLSGGAPTSTNYNLIEVTHDGINSASLFFNSALAAESPFMGAIPNVLRNRNFLGTTFNAGIYDVFDGNLAELLIFDRQVTALERLQIQYYFNQRYGVPSNPQTLPPSISTPTLLLPNRKTIVVNMSNPAGDQIRFTTDGSEPVETSILYDPAHPAEVLAPAVIKARAFRQYYRPSDVVSVTIGVDTSTAHLPTAARVLWLRSDMGVTTSGNSVVSWADLSLNSNHATAGSAAPTLVMGSALDFNGTNQYLQLPTGFANFTNGCSIFVVANPDTAALNERILDFGSGSTTNSFFLAPASATQARFTVYNNTTAQSVTGAGMTLDKFQLFEAIQNGAANGRVWINSEQKVSAALQNIPNVARTTNSIGRMGNNTLFFDGQIKEIIMYSRALSDDERKEVEAYIQQRYGSEFVATAQGPEPDPPTINVNNLNTTGGGVSAYASSTPVTVTINAPSRFTKQWTTDTSENPIWLTYTEPITAASSAVVRARVTSPYWRPSAEATCHIAIDQTVQDVRRQDLKFWLMADNGVEKSGTTTTVATWRDSSGNNRDAVKNGTAAAPTYTTTGTKAITFSGASQYLSLPADAAPDSSNSIFIVFKPTTFVAGKRLIDFSAGTTPTDSIYVSEVTSTNRANYTVFNTTANNATLTKTLTSGTRYLFESVHDASSGLANLFINDATSQTPLLNASVQSPSTTSRTINSIGRTSANTLFYAGDILEILVYGSALAEADRTAIEQYLSRKYSLFPSPTDTPSISPASQVYRRPPNITISGGSNVHYSANGALPSASTLAYASPFILNTSGLGSTVTLRAASIDPTSGAAGKVVSQTYQSDAYAWLLVTGNNSTQNGLKMWLKSDFGMVADPSGKLSLWQSALPESSGQQHDANQATVTQQPIVLPHDANGHAAAWFVPASKHNLSFANLGNLGGLHIFVVLKPNAAHADYIFDMATSTNTTPYRLERLANGTDLKFSSSATSLSTTTAPLSMGTYQLIDVRLDNTTPNASIAVNGTTVASGNLTLPTTGRTNNHVGCNYNATANFFDGNVAELLVFGDLPQDARPSIVAYLMQKYQLDSQAPPAPLFNIPSGTLSGPAQVAIIAPANAVIHITRDGTDPTAAAPVCNGPVDVYYTQTIKAISITNGVSSPISSATYTLDPNQWPAPSPSDTSPINLNLQLPTNAVSP